MKQKLQFKRLQRQIQNNLGRFLAIVLIILLGVLLFVGIKSSGPDLYQHAEVYLQRQQASDVQLISTTGFSTTDVKKLQDQPQLQVEAGQNLTALTTKNNQTVALLSLPKTLNQLQVTQGRLPKTAQEVVLDAEAKRAGYRLGQTYQLQKTTGLARTTFKIVGFVASPLYLNKTSRGTTTIGDGTINHFAYVTTANFTSKVATRVYLRFPKLASLNPFQSNYQTKVKQRLNQLAPLFKKLQTQRTTDLAASGLAKIALQQAQLAAAKAQLQQLPAAQAASQLATLDQQAQQLAQATKQVKQQAKTTYYQTTRHDDSGFSTYGELAERIMAIANVFPMFFFLIAILVTFTTMTRMVEEDRNQIGALKALGYTKGEISQSYWWYAIIAALLGTVLGGVLGSQTLPRIVFKMMQNQFSIPATNLVWDWPTFAIAAGLALFSTLGAVLFSIQRELRAVPATLLLPRAPKAGKKILLERITPLWRRLSFNQKVSYRNLFRYKARMWMGILGIAGGTGLILTGFGIRDSIDHSGQSQFSQVLTYQAAFTFKDAAQTSQVAQILAADTKVKQRVPVTAEMVKLAHQTKRVNEVTLYAVKNQQALAPFIHLSTPLNDHGAVLSEKAAELLGVQAGSTLKLTTDNQQPVTVKVTGITTNYAGHFIYLTNHYYQQQFKTPPVAKTWLVKTQQLTVNQENALAKKVLATKQVVNTNFLSTQKRAVDQQTQMLQLIVVIFIVLSGLLTFIVLYNLTNINVSERIRELSTIKVLGFFDREVTLYVARENVLLTIMGIVIGLGFGNLLTRFILRQAETEQVIFPLAISLTGYLTAMGMTVVFTLIVMLVTHRHLRKVDMISALKAND
ncbi:ABC transporter permease [Lapidilactobacillus wuchangensis]|uniref:ABC transporter permease n=1 Tax=Lapidilactobacillus wuchangensis TaxID=2486001 RepID=UPI000F7B6EFD|nr:ABC transporter permease [Lapidilactobacillus wuchangensis]